jgi:hypothetical protein
MSNKPKCKSKGFEPKVWTSRYISTHLSHNGGLGWVSAVIDSGPHSEKASVLIPITPEMIEAIAERGRFAT